VSAAPGGPVGGVIARDERGQLHAIQGDVARDLAARGVLRHDGREFRIACADATRLHERYPELAACDFCSLRPVTHVVKCDTFDDAWGGRSIAEWMARPECAALVRANRSRDLLERQVTRFGEGYREGLRKNARLFWRHYAGAVVALAQ
jgi:hypothetical protein